MNTPPTIWIFGAFNGPGHYLQGPRGAPGDPVPSEVRYRLDIGVGIPAGEQAEGARIVHPPFSGWSYVAWWDRQRDTRHGSLTGILARGEWTDEALVAAARQLAPWALRVPLPWLGTGEAP